MSETEDGSTLVGESRERYVRSMFDRIASPYDRLNRLISFGRDEAWRAASLDMLGVREGQHIADLGTGTGDLYLQLLERVGASGRVIGLDIAANMLEIAGEKARALHPAEQIDLRVASAAETGLEDASLDAVCMSWVLRNVGDRDAVYAEVLRILKPGGGFLCLDTSRNSFAPIRWASNIHLRGFMPLIVRGVGGDMDAYRYLTESTARFPMKRELAAEMKAAGFEVDRVRGFALGCIAAHVVRKPERNES
jgi:demethylmenaquinone methyltransferase / 2-methoxy-6-polyprenyl-1,4-benzoquinol methylase